MNGGAVSGEALKQARLSGSATGRRETWPDLFNQSATHSLNVFDNTLSVNVDQNIAWVNKLFASAPVIIFLFWVANGIPESHFTHSANWLLSLYCGLFGCRKIPRHIHNKLTAIALLAIFKRNQRQSKAVRNFQLGQNTT